MTNKGRRSPSQPSGRLPIWMSPWLWAGAGLLLGALVVAGYMAGALSGLWPWAPSALNPLPTQQADKAPALPNAGPAVAGDCRPLAVPLQRNGQTVTVHGQICLQDNGTWALAAPQSSPSGANKGE